MSTLEIEQTVKQLRCHKILESAIPIKEVEFNEHIKGDVADNKLPVMGEIIAIPLSPKEGLDSSLNIHKQYLNNVRAIQPIVQASRNDHFQNPLSPSFIGIFLSATVYGYGELKKTLFQYNFSLGSEGNLQLDIYFSYNREVLAEKKDNGNKNKFNVFPYLLVFPESSIFGINTFETVRAFLLDDDPETSRGTVTTVQSGDS